MSSLLGPSGLLSFWTYAALSSISGALVAVLQPPRRTDLIVIVVILVLIMITIIIVIVETIVIRTLRMVTVVLMMLSGNSLECRIDIIN